MSVNTDHFKGELAVFDIDGTITHESFDSWYVTTRELVIDKVQFDDFINKWRRSKNSYPYQASLRMMQNAIDLLPNNICSQTVYESAKALFQRALYDGKIRFKAIEEIDKHLSLGRKVVFATASYSEIAVALIDVLCDHLLIPQIYKKQIVVCGTDIHWSQKIIVHFNMCEGKLSGAAKALGLSQSTLERNVYFAYGDDPLGNDMHLLNAAKHSFIINTENNRRAHTHAIGTRLSW